MLCLFVILIFDLIQQILQSKDNSLVIVMLEERQQVKQSSNELLFDDLTPQEKIYNRNFYLRRAENDLVEEQHRKEIQMLSQIPKINKKSYEILANKLEAQIQQVLAQSCTHPSSISFEQFGQVFSRLTNKEELASSKSKQTVDILCLQLWLITCSYDLQFQTKKQHIFFIMRILMDPYILSAAEIIKLLTNVQFLGDLEKKREDYIQNNHKANQNVEQETLQFEAVIKLWHQLKIQNLSQHYSKKKPISKDKYQNQFQFKPKINEKSKLYANKELNKYLNANRLEMVRELPNFQEERQSFHASNELEQYISFIEQNDIPYHQILYKRKLQKETIMKTHRNLQEEEELMNRLPTKRAKPQEIKKIVDNLYIKKQKKVDLDLHQRDQLQEIKLCTFKPEIIKDYRSKSPSLQVKSYQKEVERLHRGRKEKQKQRQAFENLGKVKKHSLKESAPSFIERDTPKLILQINIDESRIQQIKLKGDEDAKIVAKKFVIKHNLDESMQSVLEELVEEHLKSL